MTFARGRAVALTAIVVLSMVFAGVGGFPASTAAASDSVSVTGNLEYHDGSDVVERKVMIKENDLHDSDLTNSTGGFNLSAPANTDNYDLTFEQYNHTSGVDFPRDGNPDIYALGDVDTQSSDIDLGKLTLPQAHTLNVTVVNESGTPLPDATIYVQHKTDAADAWNDAHTNGDGMAVWNGSEVQKVGLELNGTVELNVHGPSGYGSNQTSVTVDKDRSITVVVEKATTVTGSIEYANGSAAVNDTIELHGESDGAHEVTDASGNFSTEVTSGDTYEVEYHQGDGDHKDAADDNVPDFYTFGEITPTGDTYDIGTEQLPPGQNLTVTVVDEDSNAIQNASVNVHQHAHGEVAGSSRITNSSGTIDIDVVDAETGIHVEAPSGSGLADNGTHFTLSGDTTKTIVLHDVVNVSGSVARADNTAPDFGRVVAHPDESGLQGDDRKLSPDGSFTLKLAENGTYETGFRQVDHQNDTFFPKDGVPDIAIFQKVTTGTSDTNIGEQTLPKAHRLNITVLEPDGTAASNVDVYVNRFENDHEINMGTSGTTNTNGEVVLRNANEPGVELNGSVHVHVDAPDGASYADANVEYDVSSDREVTINLTEAIEVNGTILEPDGDAAAEERIEVDSREDHASTHTDSNGSFSVNIAKGDDYSVGFTQVAGADQYEATFPQDGVPDVYAVERITSDSEAALGTKQLPAPHNVTINVVDENGNAIEDARVNIGSHANDAREWARGYADSNGTFDAELVGPVNLHVEPPTETLIENGTQLDVTSDTELTFVLQNATTINGTVSDYKGDPADDTRVHFHTVTDYNGDSDETNTDGNYSVHPPEADQYHVDFRQIGIDGEAFPNDGVPGTYATGQLTDNSTPQDFTLPQGHDVEIQVVDQDGNNVSNVRVNVGHHNNDFQSYVNGETNADGMFVPEGASDTGIELNGTVRVHVEPGDGSEYLENSTELQVDGPQVVTITLSKGVPVTGTYEYANGDPAGGYTAELFGDGGDHRETQSDGTFRLRVKPDRTYRLAFKQTDFEDGGQPNFPKDGRPDLHAFHHITVDSDGEDVGVKTLPPAHLVNITVVNESGAPLDEMEIDLNSISDDDARAHHPGTTNANGEVVLNGASSPGIEVNGTLEVRVRGTSTYAQNRTRFDISSDRDVTVVVRKGVNISTHYETETGTALAGSYAFAVNDGTFSVKQIADSGNATISVAANDTYTVGTVQFDSNNVFGPRDNVTDLYEADVVTMDDTDTDLGTKVVPNASGVLHVRVVDELGNPVENARVTVFPNQQGGDTSIGWVESTNESGWFIASSDGMAGVEATGDNNVRVKPPSNGEYVETEYWKNITVTGDRTLTIQVDNANPVVNGTWTRPDGSPLTSTNSMHAFNFSIGFFKSDIPVDNGDFRTTVKKNGTYVFGVSELPTGDGIVDAWSVERDIQGDTDLGDIQLARGYNVTLNATEPDGTQADTIIGVRSAQEHWIYEYGTGTLHDPIFPDNFAQTRELANGTHKTTIYDAWTHDKLNETNITVDGADRDVTFTVDKFADIDLSDAEGLTVVRDLQSPGPNSNPDKLIDQGVNVRLNVLNKTGDGTDITETLPENYTLNQTYGVQYDGSGDVNWTYDNSTRTLSLTVTGDVENIRYTTLRDGDPGNAITWSGEYSENGSSATATTIGQDTIAGERLTVSGTVVKANGNVDAGSMVALIGPNAFQSDATDSNGDFSVTVDAGKQVDVQLYQAEFIGPGAHTGFENRDGSADVYAAERFTRVEDYDMGTVQLPIGHVVNVSVTDQDGNPVPNATLGLRHTNANGADAGLGGINVSQQGLLKFDNTTEPGVELNGTVNVTVKPPTGYVIENNSKTVTIDSDRRIEFNLTEKTGTPNMSVNYSVESTTVVKGEPINVTATVNNTGNGTGEQDVTLTISNTNGEAVNTTKTVVVADNSSETVTFSKTVSEGSWDVTVNDLDPTIVTVTNAVDVAVRINDSQIGSGQNTTAEIVVSNVTDGVGSYDINVTAGNTTVAEITGASNLISSNENINVAGDGSFVTVDAFGGDTKQNGDVVIATVTLNGSADGTTPVSVQVDSISDEPGASYAIGSTSKDSLRVVPVPAVADFSHRPTDPDNDGKYEDVNGDGKTDLSDVQALFANTDGEVVNEYSDAFDFNDNGEFDIVDVQALYDEITGGA